jgi:hypothetical protein
VIADSWAGVGGLKPIINKSTIANQQSQKINNQRSINQ